MPTDGRRLGVLPRSLPRKVFFRDLAERWLAFLSNHRESIVAFDFFTVPTVTFQFLYCFFIVEHGRRRILHNNVTRHPTSEWVVQQLREAFLAMNGDTNRGGKARKNQILPFTADSAFKAILNAGV